MDAQRQGQAQHGGGLQHGEELAEGVGIEGSGDAQAAAAGQDEFEGVARGAGRFVGDGEGEEAWPGVSLAVVLLQSASPGVEAGRDQAVDLAEGGDGQAAGLPLPHEVSPPLFFGGIARFAHGHGRALPEDDHELTMPRKTSFAGRLRSS